MKTVVQFLTLFAIVFFNACNTKPTNNSVNLSTINITVDTSELNFGHYIRATYHLDNNSTKNFSIKYRGNSSSHYPKKNFSLKFPSELCVNNELCHKKWKLNAEYIDKTFIRNKLSYDLFSSFSANNIAPKTNYITLNLNHKYHGLYTLTESVDKDFLMFSKEDSGSVLFKEPPISKAPHIHNEKHKRMVAYCKRAPFYKSFSEKDFNKIIKETYYNQRFPDVDKSNKKHLIHQLTEFIYNSNDKEFKTDSIFNNYFSLNNIIDWHLLLLVTNNGNGLLKNFYLYRKSSNHPFQICPWDYDHSFGRDGDGELNQSLMIDANRVYLLKRLLETNAFNYREKLLNKFLLLKRNNILTTNNIHKMIDENIKTISPYIEKNEQKWPLSKVAFFKESNFYMEIDLMKKWVTKQLPKVENHLNALQVN